MPAFSTLLKDHQVLGGRGGFSLTSTHSLFSTLLGCSKRRNFEGEGERECGRKMGVWKLGMREPSSQTPIFLPHSRSPSPSLFTPATQVSLGSGWGGGGWGLSNLHPQPVFNITKGVVMAYVPKGRKRIE